VKKGVTLYLTEAPDGSYRFTPYNPEFQRQTILAEDIMHEDREVLRAPMSWPPSMTGGSPSMEDRKACAIRARSSRRGFAEGNKRTAWIVALAGGTFEEGQAASRNGRTPSSARPRADRGM
jgi:hypothetical protein